MSEDGSPATWLAQFDSEVASAKKKGADATRKFRIKLRDELASHVRCLEAQEAELGHLKSNPTRQEGIAFYRALVRLLDIRLREAAR